jgi:hypothetical protein
MGKIKAIGHHLAQRFPSFDGTTFNIPGIASAQAETAAPTPNPIRAFPAFLLDRGLPFL